MVPLQTGKVNYWTGKVGVEFEKQWAAWNKAKFAISTSNGTSALHTAIGLALPLLIAAHVVVGRRARRAAARERLAALRQGL